MNSAAPWEVWHPVACSTAVSLGGVEGDAELHMVFDKVALAYRRALRENGF